MKNPAIIFYPKNAGQPFRTCLLILKRPVTDDTPLLQLDHLIFQVTATRHIQVMGSITSHQGLAFNRTDERGCNVREATDCFCETESAATCVVSFLAR